MFPEELACDLIKLSGHRADTADLRVWRPDSMGSWRYCNCTGGAKKGGSGHLLVAGCLNLKKLMACCYINLISITLLSYHMGFKLYRPQKDREKKKLAKRLWAPVEGSNEDKNAGGA